MDSIMLYFEDVVHVALKCHAGVFKAERHPEKLEQSKRCYNGRFGRRCSLQRNLQIAILEVEGAEDRATLELAGKICKVGNRIFIRLGCQVEAAKISTRSPAPVLLLDHV